MKRLIAKPILYILGLFGIGIVYLVTKFEEDEHDYKRRNG